MNAIVPTDVQPYVNRVYARRRISEALLVLLSAADDAAEIGIDPWQFAVEREALDVHGLTGADLRWLALKGLVHHAVEKPAGGQFERVFDHEVGPTTVVAETCVILTPLGVTVARRFAQSKTESSQGVAGKMNGSLRPVWDARLRELRIGGLLVKRFRVPADNQQTVLMVFEEEGWPMRIDDPLPLKPERGQRRAMHDTISSLNRHQANDLIRFSGDGSGEGIRWEFIGDNAACA